MKTNYSLFFYLFEILFKSLRDYLSQKKYSIVWLGCVIQLCDSTQFSVAHLASSLKFEVVETDVLKFTIMNDIQNSRES